MSTTKTISHQIFVNLPVENLKRSINFFTHLGFTFNPDFTDEKATCMIVSDHIYFMLLETDRFQFFTPKPISNAKSETQALYALSLPSKEAVDEMVSKAIEAGGSTYAEPQDHGWMYGHSFEDLDGHQWELGYMDLSKRNQ